MTWQQVAEAHVGHRTVLKSPTELRCVDCERTLLLPKEPRSVAASGPPPYRRPDMSQAASPEVIAFRKAEAIAALALTRLKRTAVQP